MTRDQNAKTASRTPCARFPVSGSALTQASPSDRVLLTWSRAMPSQV